jgi:paraquat-inducible protein B
MTKIDKLEIEKLVNSAAGAAEGIESLVESKDLAGAIKSVKDLLDAAQPVMKDLDKLIVDADTSLVEIRSGISDIIERADSTLANLNNLLEADSPTQTEMRAMLKEFSGMARSLRSLTDYLERHPEALLKGKP